MSLNINLVNTEKEALTSKFKIKNKINNQISKYSEAVGYIYLIKLRYFSSLDDKKIND